MSADGPRDAYLQASLSKPWILGMENGAKKCDEKVYIITVLRAHDTGLTLNKIKNNAMIVF